MKGALHIASATKALKQKIIEDGVTKLQSFGGSVKIFDRHPRS
ncbi:Hypothetical protein OINT_2001243 [Brucella intermedia LMG 3301]|uniref:Uncharacterized protein n=1 Tax=Brucella intermedia LMG 3301 TaxID=641118 RepID=C4WNV9_9HYPH|nr:Hypothetical protein OINT_2001243 [Brucella intermedia LMG 3301]